MKMLLSYLLLAAFIFTACCASPTASDKAERLNGKDDISTLLKSIAASQDGADKDGINAMLKELAVSQDAPDGDDINSLLKELAASQDDTTNDDDDDDDSDNDLIEIQTVFDVMNQVKQEQAMAMQGDDDNDDDDGDDENAEKQWFPTLLRGVGGRLIRRYGRRYLRRYAWRTIRRAGRNYIRRRYCNEKEVMLQELNDEAGDDDDDTTFAELQSLFGVLKELKAVTAEDMETADAEGLFSRARRRLRRRLRRVRRRLGRRIRRRIRRTIRRRFC